MTRTKRSWLNRTVVERMWWQWKCGLSTKPKTIMMMYGDFSLPVLPTTNTRPASLGMQTATNMFPERVLSQMRLKSPHPLPTNSGPQVFHFHQLESSEDWQSKNCSRKSWQMKTYLMCLFPATMNSLVAESRSTLNPISDSIWDCPTTHNVIRCG